MKLDDAGWPALAVRNAARKPRYLACFRILPTAARPPRETSETKKKAPMLIPMTVLKGRLDCASLGASDWIDTI